MSELYDTIGRGYAAYRRPDARVAAALDAAVDADARVVSVGAGAGSYEPRDRRVVAVEPAWTMIRQRPADAAPVVRAYGTALPFGARAFNASFAVLPLHHWSDQLGGLCELRRVARHRVVLLTWEPDGAPLRCEARCELLGTRPCRSRSSRRRAACRSSLSPPFSCWRRRRQQVGHGTPVPAIATATAS
jgi:SAM-dependent methyltransferase